MIYQITFKMASKNFEVDDLVWAKMKGYPPWPGKVMTPPANAKPKKNFHYIFFFGSENYAWIADEFIEFHNESMVEKYGNRKGELFHKAVKTILDSSKDVSKCRTPTGSTETPSKVKESTEKLNKITNGEILSKKKSPQGSSQKIKNKSPAKKIIPVKISPIKKTSKKRPHSPDLNQSGNLSSAHKVSACQFTNDELYMMDSESAKKYYKMNIVPTKKKIGFLGLSKIGQGIVKNLCDTGHCIIVWNESEECEAFAEQFKIKTAATPAAVVEEADIILCYISDLDKAKELLERDCGVLKGMERSRDRKKGFVMMSPSIDPKASHDISTSILMKGGCYLEVPVCGSRTEAEEGTLFVVAAGDKVLYDECKSCFDAISKKHLFVSAEVGTASKMNVIHNMFTGTVYASLAESWSLAKQVGMREDDFYKILQISAEDDSNLLDKLTSMMKKKYVDDVTGLTLSQMQQNFQWGLSLGHEIAQQTKVFAQANEIYKRCKSKKYGDHDVSAVCEGTST